MECSEFDVESPIRELRRFDGARRMASCAVFGDLPLQDPAQHYLMMCIRRLGASGELPSQRELSRLTQRSPATVTASLKVLERQGLISRTPDPQDQRVNRVGLTERGETLAQECHARMTALEKQMLHGLTPEECEQLSRLFSKLSGNLSELIHGTREACSLD